MVDIEPDSLVDEIVDFYIKSGDYNGLPLSKLAEKCGVEPQFLLGAVADLVRSDRVSLQSPRQAHPHVRMFDVPLD